MTSQKVNHQTVCLPVLCHVPALELPLACLLTSLPSGLVCQQLNNSSFASPHSLQGEAFTVDIWAMPPNSESPFTYRKHWNFNESQSHLFLPFCLTFSVGNRIKRSLEPLYSDILGILPHLSICSLCQQTVFKENNDSACLWLESKLNMIMPFGCFAWNLPPSHTYFLKVNNFRPWLSPRKQLKIRTAW